MGSIITQPTDIFYQSSKASACNKINCPSETGPLVIPTTVVSIAEKIYVGCETITSLIVSSTVTYIG